jgi:phosphoglycerol transferase MdoB-like AlkP superfamily enzyme
MKRVLSAFIKTFLFWFCFFVLFKLLFLLSNFGKTSQMGWHDFFGAFIHGSRMDFSMAGYLTVIPGILLVLSPLAGHKIIAAIIKWYTLLMLMISTFSGLLDIALYPAWGTRLNAQVLPYLTDLSGIVASVSLLQAIGALLAFGIIVWGSIKIFNRLILVPLKSSPKAAWYSAPLLLFLTVALIIPVRGGFNTSPLNFSSVYFSGNLYSNHAAYNYLWSFNHAILHKKVNTDNLHYFSDTECAGHVSFIAGLNQEKPQIYLKTETGKPVNVILVILESFSDKVIEPLGGLPDVAPCLNSLCKEGILFSSFYASGNRSDKGISAIFASYPSIIKFSSILLFPEKMKKLSYLPDYFGKKGYNLSFYYGGDVHFYNTNMLLIQSGVKDIISRNDFPLQISTMQKWGVPDGYLYQRTFDDLLKMKQPFFSMVYTISSHEPFDIRNFNRITEKSSEGKYCNSVAYADSCLGSFVSQLKKSPLWENTLVIITSDHTSLLPGPTTYKDMATYRIPLLWIGGVIDSAFVCNNISSQTDLASTLIQQMGWVPEPSYFAKNIFGSHPYAFFLRDEGWGFLSPQAGFFMDFQAKEQYFYYGKENPAVDSLTIFSKSFVQYLHTDFQKK